MNYKFFENKKCEYYPCHDFEQINCLFCFCPLYSDEDCGGNYSFFKGRKDCSKCELPHRKDGYDIIINKIKKG